MNAWEYGKWQWFYEANNGREGLFMNLIALCFEFLGVSVLALKLPSIICGTLTVIGTYFLSKELFKNVRIGLISSFLVATAFWAINFSRISFRANMLPFVLVFAFYFLMRGMNTRKYWQFAVSGMFFGLGFHTYIAYRIAPLIFLAMFIVFFFTRERFARNYFFRYVVLGFFTILVAYPMFHTFYVHPEYITSRTGNVSILNPEINQGHLVTTFLKSFGLSLAKYNFWGDQNWRHNFPPYPILDPITGIAFTFSLGYVIIKIFHIIHLRFFKHFNHPNFEAYVLLLP
jgi:4-amino-4-deoxy-L-arabinose transferase-like glycosyltransferase